MREGTHSQKALKIMQPIIVSGFLGSGKTQLIMPLARRFIERGHRVAILENEVGRGGIDGQRLRAEGLRVHEVSSGCLCCSLAGDLISAILTIEQDWQPDILMVEPSGVASPVQMRGLCEGIERLAVPRVAFLVDAIRWPLIRQRTAHFVTTSLQAADVVVLTKTDGVDTGLLPDITRQVAGMAPLDCPLIAVSIHDEPALNTLADRLLFPGQSPAREMSPPHAAFTRGVFSFHADLILPIDTTAEQFQAGCMRWMQDIANLLHNAISPCPFGHIKVAASDSRSTLFLNMDRLDGVPAVSSHSPSVPIPPSVSLNVILMDTQDEPLQALLGSPSSPVAKFGTYGCGNTKPQKGFPILTTKKSETIFS